MAAFSNADKLQENLELLRIECHGDSHTFREHIERLLKLYRNILSHPQESKYRSIDGAKFDMKWPRPAMKRLMLEAGWFLNDTQLVFVGEDRYIKTVMESLADARTRATPLATEWVAESKVERVNYDGWQYDDIERSRREAKAVERNRELAQFKASKAEATKQAEYTRREIQSDKRYRESIAKFGRGITSSPANHRSLE